MYITLFHLCNNAGEEAIYAHRWTTRCSQTFGNLLTASHAGCHGTVLQTSSLDSKGGTLSLIHNSSTTSQLVAAIQSSPLICSLRSFWFHTCLHSVMRLWQIVPLKNGHNNISSPICPSRCSPLSHGDVKPTFPTLNLNKPLRQTQQTECGRRDAVCWRGQTVKGYAASS